MLFRVYDIDAAPQNCDRAPAAFEATPVGGCVDASRQTACHADSAAAQIGSNALGHLKTIDGRSSCPDHGDAGLFQRFQVAAGIQNQWRIAYLLQ